ncbi:Six-hairpin glycosidase-like protein [Cadophora sp. MPI-SDFR-AT-0126]|nr:Six-hairpin glycosidase-like protein [Leotiomycetes sp. MPI-SDFR-AT-0126]
MTPMDFNFTIPSRLPLPKNLRDPHYELPQHIIPSKVHSTSGNVKIAERVLDRVPSQNAAEHCLLVTRENSQDPASIILDFGFAVAGIPFLNISSIELEHAQEHHLIIDLSVSESYSGILQPDGDGPFPFSPGADTMRRVRIRPSCPGYYEGRNVQGSQRWMKTTLVSRGSVTLCAVGFKPTTSNLPLDELPGFFECSDKGLSALWGYGARTLQLNCIPERSIPPPWSVSEDMGTLINSQRCNVYAWGGNWGDYEMDVKGMIVHDGLAWTVKVAGLRAGLLFQLNLHVDESATLEMWYGYYNKPQFTLVPTLLASRSITELKIVKHQWYSIKTVCVGEDEVLVYVDDVLVATFQQGQGQSSTGPELSGKAEDVPKLSKGSVGIGAGQDQVCRFKDLRVTSLPARENLYSSGLNNSACLGDFSTGWNQLPFIFDGAKRDRYAWTADIIIGGKGLYYSTAETKYIRGNLEASFYRTEPDEAGRSLLPGGVAPGRDFARTPIDTGMRVMSVNYSLYTLMVLYDYWMHTGDHRFIFTHWQAIKGCLSYAENLVNASGLVEAHGREAGDYDYYNGLQTGISTKRNILYVATLRRCSSMALSPLINDHELAQRYISQATRTSVAIREVLYNRDAGRYNITTEKVEGLQQETHAWLISEDLTDTTSNGAPLSFTASTPNVPPVISPIMSAFHILAALHAGCATDAENILRRVWEPMCDTTSKQFTGTTWEFMNPDLTPYSGDLCSYAQLFSVGPTFVLSQYALGVEAVEPGWKSFRVAPRLAISGVDWAQGRVPTPEGAGIEVRWESFEGLGWRLDCEAPLQLQGQVIVPDDVWKRKAKVTVNGRLWEHDNCIKIGVGADATERSGRVSVIVAF